MAPLLELPCMVFGGMVSMEVSGQSKPAGVGGNKSGGS